MVRKTFFAHLDVVEVDLPAVRVVVLHPADDLLDVGQVGRRVRVHLQLRRGAVVLEEGEGEGGRGNVARRHAIKRDKCLNLRDKV